jgi:hypothetical protein
MGPIEAAGCTGDFGLMVKRLGKAVLVENHPASSVIGSVGCAQVKRNHEHDIRSLGIRFDFSGMNDEVDPREEIQSVVVKDQEK